MMRTCDKVSEWPNEEYNLQSLYNTRVTLEGSTAVQWLALRLHSKKILGSWPFCVAFASSHRACVGFLRVLRYFPAVQRHAG